MKLLKTIGTCSLLAALSMPSLAAFVDPSNTNIQYTGRWNFDNPSEPWVAWQGSSIKIRFDGTRLAGDFDPGDGTEQFRVIIDGVPSDQRLYMDPERAEYVLAEGLSPGIHTVELFKETFYNTNLTVYGFDLDGTILAPPARPDLRIEFFGDSNMDGTSNYSERDSGDSGTYYAFPAMVSRMLGAEMHLAAVGGAKLDGGQDNDVTSFIFSDDYYNQDASYRSGFDPHIIVVNAGANDVGAPVNKIKGRYKTVIADLRSVYGDAVHIVLMNAYGWDLNEPANYVDDVVAEVGGNLSALKYSWLWEQFHGSQWEHSGEAHMLVDHLESINPAWSRIQPNDFIDGFGRGGDVANGSFEHVAPFGGFGWRYFDGGVERIQNTAEAVDGDYYLRLEQGEEVHQPIDATGDQLPGATVGGESYAFTLSMRAATPGATAKISTHFQGQEIYTHDDDPSTFQETSFALTSEWADYTHYSTSAAGIWTVYSYIIAEAGTIEVDNVRMALVGNPPNNAAPTADFSSVVDQLSVSFTDTSSDSDGSVVAWNWDFGDGNSSTQQNPTHSYAVAGDYTVSLLVEDNEGTSASANQQLTVSDTTGGGEISASVWSQNLRRGRLTVQLNWSGAVGTNVEVYRDGSLRATTANDGNYKDTDSGVSGTSFTYQICEVGGSVCSNPLSVDF